MLKLTREQVSIGVIIILHSVGLVGMILAKEWFIPLTPLNLVVSAFFVLRHAEQPKAWVYVVVAVVAYLIELLGVQSGWPFGDYSYERALGPHVFEVPLLIGILWLLLLTGGMNLIKRLTPLKWIQIAGAALLMTVIDLLIEPIAIDFEYWRWFESEVPISNYLGWLGTGLILASFGRLTDVNFGNNKVAGLFFIVQFIFFLSLNLLLV